MTRFLPLLLFIALAIFLYIGLGSNPRYLGLNEVDKPVPSFSLPQVLAPTETFDQTDFLGKVSLLNVWASWCVSCRQEHPLLMELAQQGYIIYGLNYKDDLTQAKQLLLQAGNPYQASAFDAEGTVGIEWGVTGTPETFVIDQQGIIRHKLIGPLSTEIWQQTLLPLIKTLEQRPL